MPRHRFTAAAALSLALVTLVAACGNDDGADVRNIGEECASGSASGGGSASASTPAARRRPVPLQAGRVPAPRQGPGRASPSSVQGSTTDNPLDRGRPHVLHQLRDRPGRRDRSPRPRSSPTPCVRATSRRPRPPTPRPARAGSASSPSPAWSRRSTAPSTPGSTTSPAWTTPSSPAGTASSTSCGATTRPRARPRSPTSSTPTCRRSSPSWPAWRSRPRPLAVGSSELIEEVSTGKITGEEDRYSGTDLWDFAANVEGSEQGFELLDPGASRRRTPSWSPTIDGLFAELDGAAGRLPAGRRATRRTARSTEADKTEMQTTLAELSENLRLGGGRPRARGLTRRRERGSAAAGSWPAGPRRRRPPPAVRPAWPRAAATTATAAAGPPPGRDGAGGRGVPAVPGRRTRPGSPTRATSRACWRRSPSRPPTATELRETFAALTAEVDRLMSGPPYEDRDPAYPPVYTGAVGNPPPARRPVGRRVGGRLAVRRPLRPGRPAAPRRSSTMPFLANDRLDPTRSHGDLLLSADQHPRGHQPVRPAPAAPGHPGRRWRCTGCWAATTAAPAGPAGRGRQAQPDGLHRRHRQPRPGATTTVMDRYVWVQPGDGEPAWAVGGTYHVVRVDPDAGRVLGPHPAVRAGGDHRPPQGHRRPARPARSRPTCPTTPTTPTARSRRSTPTSGWPTPARPRPRTTSSSGRVSTSRGGSTAAGQLDQGLAFVSYQRRLSQFLNTQARLAGEPLEEYIRPEGGGFYFALPGVERRGRHPGRAAVA